MNHDAEMREGLACACNLQCRSISPVPSIGCVPSFLQESLHDPTSSVQKGNTVTSACNFTTTTTTRPLICNLAPPGPQRPKRRRQMQGSSPNNQAARPELSVTLLLSRLPLPQRPLGEPPTVRVPAPAASLTDLALDPAIRTADHTLSITQSSMDSLRLKRVTKNVRWNVH